MWGGGQNKLKSFIQNKKLWILSLLKNAKQHQKIKAKLEILENQNINLTIQNQYLEKSIQTLKEQNKILSNQNVSTIHSLHKLTPQAYLKLIEIHLAEHCNLNCFSCAHFSQLSPKHFPSLEQFSKDIQQLNSITKGLVGRFHLMGGEPLLNPNCKDFFAVTRKFFPDSDIWLVTNGILLKTQPKEFWESCKENNIEIHPTKYPIKIDWNSIETQCKTYGIPLIFFNNAKIEKTSTKFVLESKGNCNPLESFTKCGMANNCVQLKEGKLYPCNIAANIEIFNSAFNQNLPLTALDSIDIYKAKDYHEILQFLAKPIPFCRFCNLSKWQGMGEWKTSKKEIVEYLE